MLSLRAISKKFPGFELKEVSFTVEDGDYFILLGESGAGKSMVLETIAGLVLPDSGSILLGGREITREKIQRRGIGLVFQDHAVFPHMTVRGNLQYALKSLPGAQGNPAETAEKMAERLSINHLLERKPATLSGGELQRVALARTLIQKPGILLLDEPLASVDHQLKSELRALLRQIHREGQTILHVTHDFEEAISLGTRVAVINNGMIVQEGTTHEVFEHPRSNFVAGFAGIKNFFRVTLSVKNGKTIAKTGSVEIELITEEDAAEGFIIIRAEDLVLSREPVDTSMVNHFRGTIHRIVPSRSGCEVTLDAGILYTALVTSTSADQLGLREGSCVWVHFKATAVKYFCL